MTQTRNLQVKAEAYNDEIAKYETALAEARRYSDAALLRQYASALSRDSAEMTSKAAWISAKADWLDPLVAADDQIFGTLTGKNYPPATMPIPSASIPYDLKRFFESEGKSPSPSWQNFLFTVEGQKLDTKTM